MEDGQQENEMIVDESAPDADAVPAGSDADEFGETIHPTEGLGVPIEPPQPANRETRVETPADSEPLPPPPLSEELTKPEALPASPPPAPSITELTEEHEIKVHECHLPLLFVKDADALVAYVNKNEYRLNKPRRKLDVSKPAIQAGYPTFAAAMRLHGHFPLTQHWYAAALILTVMGVPIDDEPQADTDAILDQLTQ